MKEFFYKKIFDRDLNKREINIYKFNDFFISGDNLFYPNVILQNIDGKIIFPLNEKIMSLGEYQKKDTINKKHKITKKNTINTPVFFFIYNTDNYYHFIYDTLPYLISFFKIKKDINDLKLLINFPNIKSKKLYKFNIEFFEILGIHESDLIFAESNIEYSEIFISDSYTHGNDSNLPPRNEIYDFFKKITNSVIDKKFKGPKKIYISRRSWIHNNFDNIGTNYTSKRMFENETELVKILTKLGFVEVFTENMNTIEKINVFFNATDIIGPIGGGLVNCLFSKKETNLHAIISPTFLDINKRFIYCMNNVNLKLFENTYHSDIEEFKLYMRVKCKNIIGEVVKKDRNKIKIQYSENFVSGWNNQLQYKIKTFDSCDCVKIDNGLNSPWFIDIEKFMTIY
jgi:hypothetical protein